MRYLVRCRNNEVVEVGTGIVQGFDPANMPRLSEGHYAEVSTDSLGSTTKIKTISKDEMMLLEKISPTWRTMRHGFKDELKHLIKSMGDKQLSIFRSIKMKKYMADPVNRENTRRHTQARWDDPNDSFHGPEKARRQGDVTRRAWADPSSKFNASGASLMRKNNARNQWRNPKIRAKRIRAHWSFWAWKRSGVALEMLKSAPS